MICLSTVQRVAKNTGIVIAGDVIFRLISLIVMIYLARYLGTADFGIYSFVFAYLAFFGVIYDLGFYAILVREMSRDSSIAPKLIGNAYIIRLLLTVFAFVLSITVIKQTSYPSDTTIYVFIAAFTLLFTSFSDFYTTIFQANLRMEYNIIAKLVFKFLSAGLIIWIIFSQGTLMQVFIAFVCSEMVKTIISYLFSRKLVRPRFEIDFRVWKFLFRESLPIALTSIVGIIYYKIDIVMLSQMEGNVAVGIYSAAYKLFEPATIIPHAVMISLFPVMSTLFTTSKDKLVKSYKLGLKYLLISGIAITIGIMLLSDKFILLIYGTEFANSATVLQILILSLVFTFANYVMLHLLVSMGKQKLNTLSMGLCATVNVILNFILIPVLSYNGAAIATVATNIVLFVACFYFVSKHLQVLPIHKMVMKPIISGVVMGAFIYYFTDVNIILLVPLAALVYLIVLIALKTFTEEDWNIVKRVLGKD